MAFLPSWIKDCALGTALAIGLWWVNFDLISHHLPQQSTASVSAWFYLHLPLTMGIAAVGAAVLNVVEHAGDHLPPELRWLLLGAIAVTLASIALLTRTIQLNSVHKQTHRTARWVMLAVAALTAFLGFFDLEMLPLLILLILLMLAPIFAAFRVWLMMLDAETG